MKRDGRLSYLLWTEKRWPGDSALFLKKVNEGDFVKIGSWHQPRYWQNHSVSAAIGASFETSNDTNRNRYRKEGPWNGSISIPISICKRAQEVSVSI